MKTFKMTLISIIILLIPSTLHAQSVERNQVSKTSSKQRISMVSYTIGTDTAYLVEQLTELLKKEINKEKTISIQVNDSTKDISLLISRKVDLQDLKLRLSKKGLWIEPKIVMQVEPIKDTLRLLYHPQIDDFLNSEDIAIFNEKFIELSDNDIHPRSREYYHLISEIHQLEIYLKDIEDMLSDTKLSELSKSVDMPRDVAENILKESAKTKITHVEEQFGKLSAIANNLQYLSKQQRSYYEELKDKYYQLYDRIYE